MCIRDHSYACVYTQGLGTPTVSQHNIAMRVEPVRKLYILHLTPVTDLCTPLNHVRGAVLMVTRVTAPVRKILLCRTWVIWFSTSGDDVDDSQFVQGHAHGAKCLTQCSNTKLVLVVVL